MLMMGEMADAYEMDEAQRATKNIARRISKKSSKMAFSTANRTVNPSSRGKRIRRFRSVAGASARVPRKSTAGIGLMVRNSSSHYRIPQIMPTPAILIGDAPWIERTLYLKVPREAEGVTFSGEWDPIGMRATMSRNMALEDVFGAR